MLSPRTRRSALRFGGTAILGSLAGCSTSALTGNEGLALGDIVVVHSSMKQHAVRLKLEHEDKIIHDITYEFSRTRKRTIQASWSRDPATYTLYTIVQGPLVNEESELNLYVNEFTGEDAALDAEECSVIHVEISAPPEPGGVGIDTNAPKPKWGDCMDN